jgi:cytochrome c peroxidase
MDVFLNKAKCDSCHEGVNFTSNAYANLGIGTDKPDSTRDVTRSPRIRWIGANSKLPRSATISKTGPYRHDGSLTTLEELVDFYDKGGTPNKNLDEKIKKLNLTAEQKKDLVEFLKALDGAPIIIAVPASFPQ